MAYVYVEQLLIDNGLINAFLLYVCMRLVRRPPRAWRLALGSLAGTLGGVALLMVSTPLPLQWAAKIVLSAAMSVICVGARDGRLFLRMFGALWAVTLAMGGASLAMVFLLGGSFAAGQGYIALAGVNPGVYIAGGWLTYLLVRHVWLRARARGQRAQRQVTLRVRVDAREMACTALVDSGHSLRTPGSNRAVLVVEKRAIAPIMPAKLARIDLAEGGWSAFMAEAAALGWGGRWTCVPFSSVGGAGVLPAFAPDALFVEDAPCDAFVALFDGQLDEEGAFAALAPPELAG